MYLYLICSVFADDKTRLSLKLRIIEKRKKAGSSNQKSDREIESALYQAVQAAYISLLLEVQYRALEQYFILVNFIFIIFNFRYKFEPKLLSLNCRA